MKELNVMQMEEINGGTTESLACSLGFVQLGLWNSIAFGLAFPPAIIGVAVGGFVLAVAGAVICDAIAG